MSFAGGSKLGSYDIVSPLGAGGMGEVYRARDAKLGREVALKVLPASFIEDPERVARFQREAQILASLNHPNIAAIYGLEQSEATPFLVLELVEGETLDARLRARAPSVDGARGFGPAAHSRAGLDLDEALPIARQIADALEAAHEKGIVHRDLKPANIVVNGDGVVKVLDFGLAKTMERGAAGERDGLTHSPTITFAATQAGVILGTAAYMSPEQAKGRAADKRTDVWAFGCVLFEMLTGKRAFEGEDVTDVIAAIVRGEPDWSALPSGMPEQLRLLIRRCLDKDRRTRVSDIGVARFLMTETIAPAPAIARPPQPAPPSPHAAVVGAIGGLVVGAAATGLLAWTVLRGPAPAPRPTARFALVPAAAQALVLQAGDRNIDMAPDGTFIVYRGATQAVPQLFVRTLGDLNARPLGTSPEVDARGPFISPDGKWVGFFAGQEVKKMMIAGGPAITLCRLPAPPRGASWGSDGTIVFGTANPSNGLMAVSASGGEPKTLIKPEGTTASFGFPHVLPGGNAVLFTIGSPGGSAEVVNLAQIGVFNRKSGEWKTLVRGGTQPQYVNGYLVYGSAGSLRATRFDLDRLAAIGDPVPIVEQVLSMGNGAVSFAVSREGSLAYVPASAGNIVVTARSLVWVTREGREEPLKLPPRPYEGVRLSPDGARLAVGIRDGQRDVWIGDLARQTLTRLTFDPTTDQAPIWTPDGKRIIWSSQRGNGTPNLYMQSADGTGAIQQLTSSPHPTFPTSISQNGATVVAWENNPVTRQDVALVDIGAAGQQTALRPLIHSSAVEIGAEVSPDGRWLAFESDESGRAEVYVRPFPNVDDGRWQVSAAGGTRPVWARSGRELFYLDSNGMLTSAPVEPTTSTFAAGNPVKVLATRYYPGFTELGLDLRGYDVSPDGKRFLMLKDPPAESTAQAAPASMVVVLNWIEELKARIPAK